MLLQLKDLLSVTVRLNLWQFYSNCDFGLGKKTVCRAVLNRTPVLIGNSSD